VTAQQVGLGEAPLESSPFVQALQEASTFCVVRNSNTDFHNRIWCVCELMYAKKYGLFPDCTNVTGPDVFAQLRTTCLDAKATELEDRDRILKVLLTEHNREEIDSIVQLFRTQDTPQQFPEINTITGESAVNNNAEHLKSILHPLVDLDENVIQENMCRFQPGTREWAIQSFDEWLRDSGTKHRVFVLTAAAGIGKTGIACKIVRDRSGHILACHFCRHDDSRRNNPKNILLSLAYQMACKLPEYKSNFKMSLIAKILKEKPF
jgi:hypothetical protein